MLGKLKRRAALSTMVTATVVTVGVTGTGAALTSPSADVSGNLSHSVEAAATFDIEEMTALRSERVSRSAFRTARTVSLTPAPEGKKFAVEALNIWKAPREKGKRTGLVEAGDKVRVTGRTVGHWAEILVKNDRVRWVNNDFLANKMPKPETSAKPASSSGSSSPSGTSSASCPAGSGPEAGLTPAAVQVYRSVCANFPQITTYGGYSPRGEHIDGRAIDVMVSGELGWQIAEYLRANAGALQVRDIIYAQKIWTPDRASEGWRPMSDRGSATANHYDHVHVAVY